MTTAPKVAFPSGEGFERPENSPVDCFQRERAGRPLGDFDENACIFIKETPHNLQKQSHEFKSA